MGVTVEKSVDGLSGKQAIDIVSFLTLEKRDKRYHYLVRSSTNEKVAVTQLVGKYVVVYAVVLPPSDDLMTVCGSVRYLCSELSAKVEVVLVPMPTHNEDVDKVSKFCSSVGGSCLHMPLSHRRTREKVCQSLSVVEDDPYKNNAVIVVDPQGNVLLESLYYLNKYGVASFPFTQKHLKDLDQADKEMKFLLDPFRTLMLHRSFHDDLDKFRRPVSLGELLQCYSLNRIGGDVVYLPDLGDKVVGIYLCLDGSLMHKLIHTHQQCIDKDLSFEIVYVHLPYPNYKSSLVERLSLQKRKVPTWLELPFDDKICRSLWRICELCYQDRLIILPPGGQPRDFHGKSVITNYGVEAYPFTRWSLLEKKLSVLRSLTLESMSCRDDPVLLFPTNGGPPVPLFYLRGKKVLLYVDPFANAGGDYLCSLMCQRLPYIRAKYPGTKVVVVPLSSTTQFDRLQDLGWLMLPCPGSSLSEKPFLEVVNNFPCVLAFGTEGQLLSKDAMSYLLDDKLLPSLFDDNLRQEIANDLARLGTQDSY